MINITKFNIQLVKESCARYPIDKKISMPIDGYEAIKQIINFDGLCEEYLFMLTLDNKNKITGVFTVSQGSLNSSLVHPREVFKRAILNNSASIIIVHNHPSGDPTPSQDDINLTKRLINGGNIIGIDVLDHLVIGDNCYTSFKQRGLM